MLTVRVLAPAAVGLAILLAGCSAATTSTTREASPGVSGARATSAAVTSAGTSGAAASAAPVTLAFAGDVHFMARTRQRLDRDVRTAVGPMARVLSAADLAMVNLETAVTERGSPQPKTYRFRAPASAFTALRSAGIDVATMANNHGLDYGPVGLGDTLTAIRTSGFPTVGIGRDAAAAYAPYVASVRGRRIAVVAGTQIIDTPLRSTWTATDGQPGLASAIAPARLVAAVRAARARADVVVVYLHWGQERDPCPIPAQRSLARALVAAGADVLIGAHAHTLLGAGYLGSTYVDFGLGNFLWYSSNSVGASTTGVLTLTVSGRRVTGVRWSPALVDDSGAPQPVTGAAAERARQRWAALRSCTGLAARPS